MTDLPIVTRLRESAEIQSGESWRRQDGGLDLCLRSALATEAADAIEAMYAALIKCRRVLKYQPTVEEHCNALDAARAALRKVRP